MLTNAAECRAPGEPTEFGILAVRAISVDQESCPACQQKDKRASNPGHIFGPMVEMKCLISATKCDQNTDGPERETAWNRLSIGKRLDVGGVKFARFGC